MPNAKLGTVTFDVAKAVKEIKAGKIDFKVEKAGIVHAPMGKVSFGEQKLLGNISAFMETDHEAEAACEQRDLCEKHCHFHDHGSGDQDGSRLVKDLLT